MYQHKNVWWGSITWILQTNYDNADDAQNKIKRCLGVVHYQKAVFMLFPVPAQLLVWFMFFLWHLRLVVPLLRSICCPINQVGCKAQWLWNGGQHCWIRMVCWRIAPEPFFCFRKRGLHLKILRHRFTSIFGAWEAICSQGRRLWLMLAPGRKDSVSNQGNSSTWLILTEHLV